MTGSDAGLGADDTVIYVSVHVHGEGEETLSPGGWAAVLTYGDHTRELGGFAPRTSADRLRLRALVEALECLTRPVRARVWVQLRCAHAGVAALWPYGAATDPEADAQAETLRRRLAAMEERHEIDWSPDEYLDHDPDVADPPYERADDLAYEGLLQAEAEVRREVGDATAPVETSLDVALHRFLLEQRAGRTRREYDDIAEVVRTLLWSIGWYSEEGAAAIPASDLPGQFGDFFYTVVHKKFAGPRLLATIRSVLPTLLAWFRDRGHLDHATAAAQIESTLDQTDRLLDVRVFVEELRRHVRGTAPAVEWDELSPEDRVSDQYLRIAKIEQDSITFDDWVGEVLVGPVGLPPEICRPARHGWQVLLSAARVDGEWVLTDVVNADL
jgi:ribonuclease HI